jgi:hypothetical protein
MAFSGWRKSGSNALLSKSGKGYWCEQCPCDDCWSNVKEAIRERQIVGSSSITPLNLAKTYTLSELKVFVRQIANVFVDGVWVPGTDAGPTMLPYAYADLAEDCEELYDLVCEMKIRRVQGGGVESPVRLWVGNGVSDEWDPDFDVALARAKANWEERVPSTWTSPEVGYYVTASYASYGRATVNMWACNQEIMVGSIRPSSVLIPHAGKLFFRPSGETGTYLSFHPAFPEERVWWEVASLPLGTWVLPWLELMPVDEPLPIISQDPSSWPTPEQQSWMWSSLVAFHEAHQAFWLMEWEFQHVSV